MSMRILFTSTSYPAEASDWKGLFILRMLEGLSRRQDLSLDAWCPPGPLPSGIGSVLHADDHAWLLDLASHGGIAHLLRKRPLRGLSTSIGLILRLRRAFRASPADIFHINWLQSALALPVGQQPALVTALGTDMQLLRLPLVRWLLRRRFNGRRVILCPNAEWMAPILEQAFGDVAKIHCIPFGIDSPWYHIQRTGQRAMPPLWLCVTRLTAGKLGPLFHWAESHFRDQGRELHLIGPRQDDGIAIPEWVHFQGPATPSQLQEEWFPRATGLISLSTHPEGRPQVMLEAMAAGLPILASRQPAHEDIVMHRQTGWICDTSANFAEALAFIESPRQNAAMGELARQAARKRFGDWDDCADRYARLYGALLEDRS